MREVGDSAIRNPLFSIITEFQRSKSEISASSAVNSRDSTKILGGMSANRTDSSCGEPAATEEAKTTEVSLLRQGFHLRGRFGVTSRRANGEICKCEPPSPRATARQGKICGPGTQMRACF